MNRILLIYVTGTRPIAINATTAAQFKAALLQCKKHLSAVGGISADLADGIRNAADEDEILRLVETFHGGPLGTGHFIGFVTALNPTPPPAKPAAKSDEQE